MSPLPSPGYGGIFIRLVDYPGDKFRFAVGVWVIDQCRCSDCIESAVFGEEVQQRKGFVGEKSECQDDKKDESTRSASQVRNSIVTG